MKGDKMKE